MMRERAIYAAKNSVWGLIAQTIPAILSFIARKVFLVYLDVEYLGISATFTSILQTLSLSELGFQTAVVYFLYKPLAEKDTKQVNQLINYFGKIYKTIAFIILCGSIIISPFIPRLLKGVIISKEIYYIFILHVLSVVASYLLAYKRALLYADQKSYIISRIDMLMNIIAFVLRIITVILFKSYVLYVLIQLIQTIISNIYINYKCEKIYPFLDKCIKENREIRMNIWRKIKDIVAGNIAGYVYGGTDNLIISTFVNTRSVGYLSNYVAIKAIINGLLSSIMSPILPSVGNYLTENKSKDEAYKMYLNLTFIRFILALILLAPMASLIQLFIEIWIGDQYILPYSTVILIVTDLYCSALMGPNGTFLSARGDFKAEKRVAIIGALTNIVISISLVGIMGINGVLIGTVVSQLMFWVGRYIAVDKSFFRFERKQLFEYIQKNVIYMFIFIISVLYGSLIISLLKDISIMVRFLLGGVLIEIVNVFMMIVLLRRFYEYEYFMNTLKNIVIRKTGLKR